jgi:sulfatase maturation enzyme AslB (radical SAM superfamily)
MGAGEPFMDPKYTINLLSLIKNHSDLDFIIYTNGTTITKELVDAAKDSNNLLLLVSIEGFKDSHDLRRGHGSFDKIMGGFDLLNNSGIAYGYSAVVHHDNYKEVTSLEFINYMAKKGNLFGVYNQFFPIYHPECLDFTKDSSQKTDYLQRLATIKTISPIYIFDLQVTESNRYGCMSKKGSSCFVDAINGKVSPCFLFPFSSEDSNIYEKRSPERLKEILSNKFFTNYRIPYRNRVHCSKNTRFELEYLISNPNLSYDDRLKINKLLEVPKWQERSYL